jgi:6-phosphogluconolactonase (cycloisomerase 2 family)
MGTRLRLLIVLAVAGSALAFAPQAPASNLYVSNAGNDSVSPFSIQSDGTLSPIACSVKNCTEDAAPQGVGISPNGRFLYAANAEASGTVAPFAIRASGSLSPIACSASNCAAGEYPYWVATTPNGKFLYVTNYESDSVSPYTIGSHGSLTPIACSSSKCRTGVLPEEPAISPNGKYLYVENATSNGPKLVRGSVSVFSIASNGSLKPLKCSQPGNCATGAYPWASAITPNGKYLYVANDYSDSISPFAIRSNGSLKPVVCSSACSTGSGPYGIAVSPNGKFAYVPNNGDGTVSAYSIKSNGSLKPIACSPSTNCSTGSASLPTSATMSPNGKYLYVTSYDDSVVVVFAVAKNGSLSPVTCTTSNCGGIDEPEYGQSIVITPDQAPTASFSATVPAKGHTIKFNASKSTAATGQEVAKYAWSFGDGSHATTTTAKVKHTYKKAATYTVTLTVTDNASCSTTVVFTGQTAYCHGGPGARKARKVVIK